MNAEGAVPLLLVITEITSPAAPAAPALMMSHSATNDLYIDYLHRKSLFHIDNNRANLKNQLCCSAASCDSCCARMQC
jgi:hypothetical protein